MVYFSSFLFLVDPRVFVCLAPFVQKVMMMISFCFQTKDMEKETACREKKLLLLLFILGNMRAR